MHETSPNPLPPQAAAVQRHIAIWLFCLCALIGVIVLVGGMTRLTDSGLSITEWKPVTGVLPPLNADMWESEFAKYRQIPEYQLINRGMSLQEFKNIYWWEWGHRLLGRLAGVAFLGPFLFFWLRGSLARRDFPRMLLMFVLGGAQGALGWYMVKSGLSDRVDVSQYRLTAHLGLAFTVYGYILWVALGHWQRGRPYQVPGDTGALRLWGIALCAVISAQILLGALVAGLDAGLTYNSWPLMDGRLVPEGLFILQPAYLNPFENITMVQFNHRAGAILVMIVALGMWMCARRLNLAGPARLVVNIAVGAVIAQFALGIWTLLRVSPIHLAAAHQIGALAVFTCSVILVHFTRKTVATDTATP